MANTEIETWLQESITAVKSGESQKARELLLRVLKVDDHHEKAWLWLSAVVDTDEERRTCLENVLAVNPHNNVAQAGLAKLGAEPAAALKRYTVRREKTPVSLASAVLYPEQQVQEWSWEEPEVEIRRQGNQAPMLARSTFNDIWSGESDMCAYCAHELAFEDERCPHCRQQLKRIAFRYAKPSRHLYVLFVLLINQAQLFLVQVIYDVIQNKALVVSHILLPLIFMSIFLGLAMGINFRQIWAYVASIVLLFMFLLIVVTSIMTPIDFTALQLPVQDPAVDGFLQSFGDLVSTAIRICQIIAATFALIYAILLVGPDFVRDEERITAVVTKGLRSATQYHSKAKELSKRGMWASAVLHWQRAVGQEPHVLTYQHHLGLAYAQLGFYERSLDMLNSALTLAKKPAKQKELKNMIQTITNIQSSAHT